MPNNPNGPIRRGQLIVPFGTGAMINVPGGTSLVISGLDYWFRNIIDTSETDFEEFRVDEWRLQRLLGVDHFRLPPDYREGFQWVGEKKNLRLTIPSFRFPTWHFCPTCKTLYKISLFDRGIRGKIKCEECLRENKTRYLVQVPFITICENGHLNDFPWREWVHESLHPTCDGKLKLISTGSATLGGQLVRCECGEQRSLAGITSAGESSTNLSSNLSDEGDYLCPGGRPWFGDHSYESCNAPVRGSLRSALNVYFGQMKSSIYLPRSKNTKISSLISILEDFPYSTMIKTLLDLGAPSEQIASLLVTQHSVALGVYSNAEVIEAVEVIRSTRNAVEEYNNETDDQHDGMIDFRREEFNVLRKPIDEEVLKIKPGLLDQYDSNMMQFFSNIMLIDKLRETRVLSGFSRVYPENDHTLNQRKEMLWKDRDKIHSWLPAYIVYGEGIFIEFDEALLNRWEKRSDVQQRVKLLVERYEKAQEKRRTKPKPIGARFILIHTFSHILMNRLTYECGYSSAALRERIFVSEDEQNPMAGLLIYTADGDADGTLGGVVRMGKPGYLEPAIAKAIESARWCSADPVCMEMGNMHGQGPDSCNLAACHNCALVPETACEEFNRFLDRGLLIGELENPGLGYFNS